MPTPSTVAAIRAAIGAERPITRRLDGNGMLPGHRTTRPAVPPAVRALQAAHADQRAADARARALLQEELDVQAEEMAELRRQFQSYARMTDAALDPANPRRLKVTSQLQRAAVATARILADEPVMGRGVAHRLPSVIDLTPTSDEEEL